MSSELKERLDETLQELSSEEANAVLAFAEFLAHRNHVRAKDNLGQPLTDEEHRRLLQALESVAALSTECGPPVSNRDHDKYLYGAG